MKTIAIFNSCAENKILSDQNSILLEKILTIKSPMKFDDNFVSNEEIDAMLLEMESADYMYKKIVKILRDLNCLSPHVGKVKFI